MLLNLKTPTKEPIFITSFSSYKLYLILQNQFRKGYNPLKYNWKINIKEQSFLKRKDKQYFEKISKKYDIFEQQKIFMINLLLDPDMWIGDMLSTDNLSSYRKYISRFNDISILFKEDVINLIVICKSKNKSFKQLFQKEYNFPIFKFLQNESISYETFILLDSYFNFIEEMDLNKDFIWEGYSTKIKQYKNLFEVNKMEVINILKEIFKNYT